MGLVVGAMVIVVDRLQQGREYKFRNKDKDDEADHDGYVLSNANRYIALCRGPSLWNR